MNCDLEFKVYVYKWTLSFQSGNFPLGSGFNLAFAAIELIIKLV